MFRQIVVSTLVLSLVFVPISSRLLPTPPTSSLPPTLSTLSSLPPTQSSLLPTLVSNLSSSLYTKLSSSLTSTTSTSSSRTPTTSTSSSRTPTTSTSSSLTPTTSTSSSRTPTSTSVTMRAQPTRVSFDLCGSDRDCRLHYRNELRYCVDGGRCSSDKPSDSKRAIPVAAGGTLASLLLVITIALVCHFRRKLSSTPPNTQDHATERDSSSPRENPVQNINYPQYSNTAEGGVVLDLSLMAAMSQQPPPYKFKADPIPPPPPYEAIDNSNTNSGYS